MPKQRRVSRKARTKKAETGRFVKAAAPGPGFVWHEPFEYKTPKGLVVRVRGHWERRPKGYVPPESRSGHGPEVIAGEDDDEGAA
jgi:hypothetical protein